MNTQKSIAFHTLGCKLNFSETSTIARQMQAKGYEQVDFKTSADVYVINTCSVTDDADAKCRNIVRKCMKQNKDAFIVVIGCYAQLKPKEIASIKGVDLVLGAAEKFQLADIIDDATKNACGQVLATEIENANFLQQRILMEIELGLFSKFKMVATINVLFCTIPLARGKSRSDTLDNIKKNAQELATKGIKEVVITGVNTGDYGKGIEENYSLLDVIKMLDKIDGIERYRISSIEPNLLTNEIIDFVAQSNKFMPHFHIPLQSGSNKILALMQRRYKRELYQDRVEKIKSVMPDACIGVDVIVGFPNETHEDFLETYNFINNLDISYLHVFTYSERANTKAIDIDGAVDMSIRKERNLQLRNLSDKKQQYFYQQFKGNTRTVLFEAEEKEQEMFGYTDNYIKISTPYNKNWINTLQAVEIS